MDNTMQKILEEAWDIILKENPELSIGNCYKIKATIKTSLIKVQEECKREMFDKYDLPIDEDKAKLAR